MWIVFEYRNSKLISSKSRHSSSGGLLTLKMIIPTWMTFAVNPGKLWAWSNICQKILFISLTPKFDKTSETNTRFKCVTCSENDLISTNYFLN